MWSALPDDVGREAIRSVGGERLGETLKLSMLSRRFRAVAPLVSEEHLRSPSASVRLEALEAQIAFAERGYPKPLQLVIGRACDEDVEVRRRALNALCYLVAKSDDEAPQVAAVAAALARDADSSVRDAARSLLLTVSRHGDDGTVAAIVGIACDCGLGEEVRRDAVSILGALAGRGHREAVAAVQSCVGDACTDIRREAVAALGDVAAHGDRAAIRLLCDIVTDPDVIVRSAAIIACSVLSPRGDEEAVGALVGRLDDSRPSVRARALAALSSVAELGDTATIAAVEARAKDDADEEVRVAAARASKLLADLAGDSDAPCSQPAH